MAEASVEVDADPLEPREVGLSHVEGIENPAGEDMSILLARPQSSIERTSVLQYHHQQQQPAPGRDRSADDNRAELPTTPLPPYYHFNTLLLEISEGISSSELEKIKFIYKDEIKSKLDEKIGNALELFRVLEKRRYIVPENLIHLQKCVMMIDDQQTRVTLMERIFKYSQEHKAVYFRRSTDEPPNGYRRYQCHIKGVEHYKFNTESVRDLMYTVASLTGIDQSEILVDEIQMTNSIYITFLVKEVLYTIFHALLKKGLPLLSELNVDMVTFLDAENGETIDVSSGRTIYPTLPPVQESPEQTIQRLSDAIEKVQLQNIDQKREIEQLSATVELLSAEVQMDSKTLSENVQEAMHDAYEEGVSKPSVLRVISLNTKLVKNIEKKRSSAMESKLRAEIQCLEAELEDYKVKLQLLQENIFPEDEPVHVKTKRKLESLTKDPPIDNGEHTTDVASDKAEQDLLDSLQVALNRAQYFGYDEAVIDKIVSVNTAYIKHKCTMQWHTDKQLLLRNNHLLQEKVVEANTLLQRAGAELRFKQTYISQLEGIFRSEGIVIPYKGYKEDVIRLAMNLSSQISDDEEQKLLDGFNDVEITLKVKADRRFLLLRLYYVENLNTDTLILLEDFVEQKLHVIDRGDLKQIWIKRVRASNPAPQIPDSLKKMMEDMGFLCEGFIDVLKLGSSGESGREKSNIGKMLSGMQAAKELMIQMEDAVGLHRSVKEEFVDLFKLISSKLTDHELSLMRKMLPEDEHCPDQDLMLRLVQMVDTSGFQTDENETIGEDGKLIHGPNAVISMLDWAITNYGNEEPSCAFHVDNCPDVVMVSVQTILGELKRLDLYEEFEIRFGRLTKGINPKIRELLRSTCSGISKEQKEEMKNSLKDKRFVDNDDDILGLLATEHLNVHQKDVSKDELDAFVRNKLDEIKHQSLYDEFEKRLMQIGLEEQRDEQKQARPQPDGIDKQGLILEKVTELSELMKSMNANQAAAQTATDVHNVASVPSEQSTPLQIFINSIRIGEEIGLKKTGSLKINDFDNLD